MALHTIRKDLPNVVFSKRASTAHAADEYAAEVKKISCRINGHDVVVPEGTTILGAAMNLGKFLTPFREELVDRQIYIPTLLPILVCQHIQEHVVCVWLK